MRKLYQMLVVSIRNCSRLRPFFITKGKLIIYLLTVYLKSFLGPPWWLNWLILHQQTPAPPKWASVHILVAPLLIKIPAYGLEVAKDGSKPWDVHVGDLDEAPSFTLAEPWLLWLFGEGTSGWMFILIFPL